MKKWYAVIGDPIAHSLSPFMHETWFSQYGVDAAYIPLHIEPSNLKNAVDAMKTLGISGFNVTLPHKQAIIPCLDKTDETAVAMNAVNTVAFDGTHYSGSNTDGDGFVQSLLVHELKRDAPVLIIGAGGAARGIAFALKRAKFTDVSITNRTYRRAEELAKETGSASLLLTEAEKRLGEFSIVIQTTSVGLAEGEALPLSIANLSSGALVADIIYNPLETPFLKEARKKQCRILNGVGMFVYQGAIAFEKWTGIQPDTEKMIELITQKLGGNYVNR